MLDRRSFLTATALGLMGVRRALAMGVDSKVGIALLRHGAGFDQRPGAVEQLLWEANKRTSIDLHEKPITVEPTDPDLFRWPLIVWIGTQASEPLSDEGARRLGRYLRAGGLLFIDDASPLGDDGFDASVRREIPRLLPEGNLAKIDEDHTLYRSFYLLREPYGRVRRQNYLEAVDFDERSPILYSRNDLFGAFGRDSVGGWLLPMGGDARDREMAFRLGINLLMYATCLDYKRDQVHVTAILRRRRWRVDTD
jgi:hypothetical protein